jgi:Fe2+ or Zn2+ uptake regulation protein
MSQSETQTRLTLDTDDPVQRWRYRCPRGHTRWEPTNHHYFCQECARRHDDVDPDFEELIDKKTGNEYERDEVEIVGYRSKTA